MKKLQEVTTLLIGCLIIFITTVSCGSADDPKPVNDEELITTVNVTFTNSADANDVILASFEDIDGPGGNDGIITNPTLTANTTYSVSVQFLNESVTPTDDITIEVQEEDEDHQVFFVTSAGLNFDHTYSDQDINGNPVGISNSVTIGNAGTGNMEVILVHLPNKNAEGVSEGNITNAGGDEDIHIYFDVTVQ